METTTTKRWNQETKQLHEQLFRACVKLLHALDYKPGEDLGQRALANAYIEIRSMVEAIDNGK
jgi:hypothetical protein